MARLPSAYQEVEYLQSDGKQWINTGINPYNQTNITEVGIKAKMNDGIYQSNLSQSYIYGVDYGSREGFSFRFRPLQGDHSFIVVKNYILRGISSAMIPASIMHTIVTKQVGSGWITSIDDTDYNMSAVTVTHYSGNIFLFTVNRNGSAYMGMQDLCIAEWWFKSDTLNADLIPCYRKSDSVAGMYDLVSNTFLTNSGSGTFIVGPDVPATILIPTYKRAYILNNTKISTYKSARVLPRLPNEYQEVEYLESTGTQWINTGILPRWGISGKIKFNQSQAGTYMTPFGCRSQYFVPIRFASTYQWEIYYGNTRLRFGNVPSTLNTDFVAEFTTESGKQITTVGDQSVEINDTYVFTTPITCALFGSNNNNAVYRPWIGRIYYCELNFDGEPTRNLIPCYRKSDSVAGMYDLVNNVFYTNAGSGSFTVGPNKTSYKAILTKSSKYYIS